MNILTLNYEYPPLGGGGAHVTKSLAEELVNQGHDIDVVTMSYDGLRREEFINGVHIYRVPSIRRNRERCSIHEMMSYCISAGRFLPDLLKEKEYDINHTHFIIPTGIVSSLYEKQIPYIVTAHGSDVPGYNPDRFQFFHFLLKPFSRFVLNRASCTTSPSLFLKNEILMNFGERRIDIIPNGITTGTFQSGRKENKILTVSRLFERKGIQYIIQAMKDIEGFRYVICGDGPFRSSLEKRVKRLNIGHKVQFMGYLEPEQLRKEYESAAIFILPSLAENFPVVLLEAMAAECAVITSDNTGCTEVVGDAGLLTGPGNVESIIAHLQTLVSDQDLVKQLGEKGRKRIETEFTWPSIAGKYANIYHEALDRWNHQQV